MKNPYFILAICIVACNQLFAQKAVLFSLKHLPNTNYSGTTKMEVNMEMNIEGDSVMINKAKSNGVTFPMVMSMQNDRHTNIKTGTLNFKNEIPFVLKMMINGKDTPLPMQIIDEKNYTFYGVYTADNKAKIDSVEGGKINDQLKEMVVKLIDGIQANLKFPENPMKIGDSFNLDIPVEFPIAGINAKLTSKTTYKLVSIDNNKADFNINYVLTMDMDGKSLTMNMTGDGNGKFTYDIIKSYPTDMVSTMNVTYSMTAEDMKNGKITGKAKVTTNNQIIITGVN